jgi:hypothetical protein
MANESVPTTRPAIKSGFTLSLDVWAVTVAFALAALVRVGVLKNVSW